MMLYVWIAVLVLAVILEAVTNDLVAIWFFPAAVISLVMTFFPAPIWAQILVFVVVGLILVISTRPFCRKFLKSKNDKTNVEAIVGRVCIVTEEIRNIDEVGEVKVGGLCWSARAEDPARTIAVGEQVTVVAVQGVKLIVK